MSPGPETPLIRDLMRFKPDALTPNGWAVMAGVSRTVWADMRRHGNPSRKTLDKLLTAAGSSLAEFEALRIGDRQPGLTRPGSVGRHTAGVGDVRAAAWRSAPLPPVPIVHSAMAGEWQAGTQIEMIAVDRARRVDLADRPVALAADAEAFAVTVVGDAMWPRFRPGRRLLIAPGSPVEIGDDVIVILRQDAGAAGEGALALIKEITRRTASLIELRQFNPDVTFHVDMTAIADIHKVAGELF